MADLPVVKTNISLDDLLAMGSDARVEIIDEFTGRIMSRLSTRRS